MVETALARHEENVAPPAPVATTLQSELGIWAEAAVIASDSEKVDGAVVLECGVVQAALARFVTAAAEYGADAMQPGATHLSRSAVKKRRRRWREECRALLAGSVDDTHGEGHCGVCAKIDEVFLHLS